MGWPVLGYLLEKNFRRRDRDHLVPPRGMDAAVCRAEVCYPFGGKHGRHRAVNRREFITLLGGGAVVTAVKLISTSGRAKCSNSITASIRSAPRRCDWR